MNEILVYHAQITKGHEMKLTPSELALYIHLTQRKNMERVVETSLDLLDARIKFMKTSKRNKVILKELLDSLVKKEAITYKEDTGIFDIEITYHKTSFDLVPKEVIEKANSPEELFLMVFVYRYMKFKDVCKLSLDFIGELLEVSRTKAFQVVEELVNTGRLYKIQGVRKPDSTKRQANSYFLPFLKGSQEDIEDVEVIEEAPEAPTEDVEVNVQEEVQEVTEEPAEPSLSIGEQYEKELAERLTEVEKLPTMFRKVKEKKVREEVYNKYFPREKVVIDFEAYANEKSVYKPREEDEPNKFTEEQLEAILNEKPKSLEERESTTLDERVF